MRPLALLALICALNACSQNAPAPSSASADDRRMREKASEDYRRPTYQEAPVVSYTP